MSSGSVLPREQALRGPQRCLYVPEAQEAIVATTVLISYHPPTERAKEELDAESYRSYLRRAHSGPVSEHDEWDEFVSTGCGTTEEVVLRVEAIEGGEEIGEETVFEFHAGES